MHICMLASQLFFEPICSILPGFPIIPVFHLSVPHKDTHSDSSWDVCRVPNPQANFGKVCMCGLGDANTTQQIPLHEGISSHH